MYFCIRIFILYIMTNGEIIYICKDLLKIISDDATFENEHILFLANKFRNLLIKKYYETPKKSTPDSMYQTICIDLTYGDNYDICGTDDYLISADEVPYTMSAGNVTIYPINFMLGNIDFVPSERFKYIKNNKYLKNIIFATIGPDNHLYLKSSNKQFLALEKVKMTAVFEDSNKAATMSCSDDCCNGDNVLDQKFPIEDALVPELIEFIVKELATGLYHPADEKNNAKDDLSDIMQFIRQNMKDRYLRDYGG